MDKFFSVAINIVVILLLTSLVFAILYVIWLAVSKPEYDIVSEYSEKYKELYEDMYSTKKFILPKIFEKTYEKVLQINTLKYRNNPKDRAGDYAIKHVFSRTVSLVNRSRLLPVQARSLLEEEQIQILYKLTDDYSAFVYYVLLLPEMKDWLNVKDIGNYFRTKPENVAEVNKILYQDLIYYINIRRLHKADISNKKHADSYLKATDKFSKSVEKLNSLIKL